MQYIRERLSLNLALNQPTTGSNAPDGQEAEPDVPDTPPKPPARKIRDGAKLSEVTVSPTTSTFSTASNHHQRTQSVDTTPSTYGTPFQSPVASEKWYPHGHIVHPQQASTPVVRYDKRTSSGVFVVDHGQFSGFPQGYSTPVNGGYVNHTFTNDSGSNENNPVNYTQQRVIREQYWAWSCKCRRQFSNREKILVLVIFFLLLVIGGLAAYLGIISEDGNPLQGGLLTPGVLHQKALEVQHL